MYPLSSIIMLYVLRSTGNCDCGLKAYTQFVFLTLPSANNDRPRRRRRPVLLTQNTCKYLTSSRWRICDFVRRRQSRRGLPFFLFLLLPSSILSLFPKSPFPMPHVCTPFPSPPPNLSRGPGERCKLPGGATTTLNFCDSLS